MVLCVDEKTQIQALERTQPLLPVGLDVATGEVLAQCRPRHRHQEILGFLRQIETSAPEDLKVHRLVDNYRTQARPGPWASAQR